MDKSLAPVPHEKTTGKSYWDIVWKQFKKKTSAVISVWIILFFFFIAIFAPLIANNNPLAIYTSYGEFYKDSYASWEKTHEKLLSSILNQKSLMESQKKAQIQFDVLKKKVYLINKKKDELKNKYEKTKGKITELEEAIEKLSKNTSSRSSTEKDKDVLIQRKLVLENKRKVLGRQEKDLAKERVKKLVKKDGANILLIQLKSQLDYGKMENLVLDSLKALKFPVSDETASQIDKYIEQYDAFFSGITLEKGGLNQSAKDQVKQEMDKLHGLVAGQLTFSNIRNHLVRKLTFPAFRSLSSLDITFMILFLILVASPLINKLLTLFIHDLARQKRLKRYIIFGLLGVFAFVLIINPSRPFIPTDYKKLFISNIEKTRSVTSIKGQASPASQSEEDYAIFPPVPYGFNENFSGDRYESPFSATGSQHLLGTDNTGRDVLSRMIWGARISLSVGFVAVSIYVFIGVFFGAVAGYFGGKIDIVISRFIEIVICFPSFFLILTIIAFVGPSITNIMIVIGFTSWPGVARLTRGEFLKLRNQDFVMAAKSLGVPDFKIIFKHILPNALTPVLVSATFGIASAMLIEASLSYLGFGVREPFPSWGQMISVGQSNVLTHWWLSLIPGIAIFISVTTYNLVGDALREAIDPRLKE
ncbi:MAG TPA: ABC transporter permease subunit [Spirochaetes bacterium]|nr:ABC transporter permease subunit [Spirochaetota bacterium]